MLLLGMWQYISWTENTHYSTEFILFHIHYLTACWSILPDIGWCIESRLKPIPLLRVCYPADPYSIVQFFRVRAETPNFISRIAPSSHHITLVTRHSLPWAPKVAVLPFTVSILWKAAYSRSDVPDQAPAAAHGLSSISMDRAISSQERKKKTFSSPTPLTRCLISDGLANG